MMAMIEPLVAAGHAYVAEDHVLFDVRRCPITANCRGVRWTR